VAAAPAFAKGPGHGAARGPRADCPLDANSGSHPRGAFWHNPTVRAELGLTDQQLARLDGLYAAERHDLIDLGAATKKAQLALGQAMRDDAFDLTRAKKAAADLSAAHLKLTHRRLEHHAAVRAELTAEQREKLAALVPEKIRDRREARRHHRSEQRLTP